MTPDDTFLSPMPLAPAHQPHRLLQRWKARVVQASVQTQLRVVSAAVAALWLSLAVVQHQSVLHNARERAMFEAAMLEDHTSRLLDTVAVTMGYVAQQIKSAPAQDTKVLDGFLDRTLMNLPYLSSLYLLDASGRVLTTTVPGEVGKLARLNLLGTLPELERDSLGSFIQGHSLVQAGSSDRVLPPAGSGQVAITRALSGPRDETIYLVALVNPESFTRFQSSVVAQQQGHAYWMKTNGELLASTNGHIPARGQRIQGVQVPAESTPRHAPGSALGAGVGAGELVQGKQLALNRPLMVQVERPYHEVVKPWAWRMLGWAVAGLLLVAGAGAALRAVHRNVRQRRAAHEQLRNVHDDAMHREERLYNLVKGVQSVLIRTDLHGQVQYVNDRWAELCGVPAQVQVGKPLASLFDASSEARVAELFRSPELKPQRLAAVTRTDAQGDVQHFDLTLVPVSTHRTPGGFVGTLVETTERERAKQALFLKSDLIATCLEANPLPASIVDAQGRFSFVNQAWVSFMGTGRDSVIGKTRGEVLGEAHAALDAQAHARGGMGYETQVPTQDGRQRQVKVTQVMLSDAHAPQSAACGTFSVWMDVTEDRSVEQAIELTKAQLENHYRAKCAYTSQVTREMMTPLQTILGFSELGLGKTDRDQPPLPMLHGMFHDIQSAGVRIQGMVEDLLALADLESGATAIDPERTDLRALVYPVLRELQPQIDHKQLQLHKDLGDVPLMVRVDTRWMIRVLRHAVEHTVAQGADGAELEVSAHLQDDDRIVLSVAERSAQASTHTDAPTAVERAAAHTAADLDRLQKGLALCSKIMQLHEGHVEVTTTPSGVCFQLTLPRYRRFNGLSNF